MERTCLSSAVVLEASLGAGTSSAWDPYPPLSLRVAYMHLSPCQASALACMCIWWQYRHWGPASGQTSLFCEPPAAGNGEWGRGGRAQQEARCGTAVLTALGREETKAVEGQESPWRQQCRAVAEVGVTFGATVGSSRVRGGLDVVLLLQALAGPALHIPAEP